MIEGMRIGNKLLILVLVPLALASVSGIYGILTMDRC